MSPTFEDVQRAHARIRDAVHRTPVITCKGLDDMAEASLFLKAENFQRVGAFKFRGATNAVRMLGEAEARAGVATHSSGNHAAALARAARERGIPAHIVMPESAPAVKRAAVEGYGARVVECASTQAAREGTLAQVVEETGATFVHPYEDPRVIAGQGTAALELLEDVPDLDMVLAPVGGGGLLSGTALAVTARAPSAKVVGCEPAAADDAYRSFKSGIRVTEIKPRTICDGLRMPLGERPFSIIREHVADIVTVAEDDIVAAMWHVWERAKIVIEPSSAVPVAAALRGVGRGKRVGIILSGGNVDLAHLPF